MIYGLGMQELLVILAIVMLLFGGKKLPEVGRNLGKAIRGFKQAENETMKELKKAAEGGEEAEEGKKKEEGKREEAEKAEEEAAESGAAQAEEAEEEKGEERTGEEGADEVKSEGAT